MTIHSFSDFFSFSVTVYDMKLKIIVIDQNSEFADKMI